MAITNDKGGKVIFKAGHLYVRGYLFGKWMKMPHLIFGDQFHHWGKNDHYHLGAPIPFLILDPESRMSIMTDLTWHQTGITAKSPTGLYERSRSQCMRNTCLTMLAVLVWKISFIATFSFTVSLWSNALLMMIGICSVNNISISHGQLMFYYDDDVD